MRAGMKDIFFYEMRDAINDWNGDTHPKRSASAQDIREDIITGFEEGHLSKNDVTYLTNCINQKEANMKGVSTMFTVLAKNPETKAIRFVTQLEAENTKEAKQIVATMEVLDTEEYIVASEKQMATFYKKVEIPRADDILNECKAEANKSLLEDIEELAKELAEDTSAVYGDKKDVIDDYLMKYIPKKHKEYIKAIYQEGKIYTARLKDGTVVTGIKNWELFKKAIKRAIEQ